MENIIGKAISYLEENGIDTSNMTLEEIIAKYNEMAQGVQVDGAEEEQSEIDNILRENAEIINSLTDEQRGLFDKIIQLVK